jgi:diguanylate cyclase (GGDEF)-like protein
MASIPRPIKPLIAPIFGVVFCFCAIFTYVLIDARNAAYDHAADVAASLATAIEADISRNMETVDLSLQSVVDNLKLPGIERLDPKIRNLILFDRSATARYLGRLVVLDEQGKVRFDANTLAPPPTNFADRDYFQAQKNSSDAGLFISRPLVSRLSGNWIVAVSRRLSHPDGSFAGVAGASLQLSHFSQLFKGIALWPDGNVTLSRTDGIVLMRWPYKLQYIGLDLHDAKLYEQLAHSRTGHFETYSATDGLRRLVVYSQIGNLPLVIDVGQSTADIYRHWNNFAFGIAFMIAILCAVTFLLAIYLMHEFGLRRRAETKLLILAATDPLTNLSNRRHFNETLDLEWRRATRDLLPLALIMIDADYFKAYNDVNGHQAGDLLLHTLGLAIADSLNRGDDIGARYGGDEFAVLVPATTLAGAKRVADIICLGFAELSVREHTTNLGLSIGVACVMPSKHLKSSKLVRLADEALYCAKDRGRNRTELAASPPGDPAADLAPAGPRPPSSRARYCAEIWPSLTTRAHLAISTFMYSPNSAELISMVVAPSRTNTACSSGAFKAASTFL